ncbi:MAG: transketolase [Candidatus Woesearchaeota archaeon]|nr:MAG: transketolase [Candidatus Woesearchaeota archaeon]
MIDKIATRDGYGRRLAELDNDKIIVLTADLAESSRVKTFAEKHPERFIQVGISEQDMFGMANGLALEGKIPITNTFAAFCLRGHEQIRLIAINNSNVKIAGHHSGISLGQDGVSQMCEEDISVFRTMPNFTVVVPCDALEAQKALDAIIQRNGPCYLRLSREPSPIITNEYSEFKIGKANILREGTDVLIIACGLMVSEALRAANLLAEKGISACIMNMHTIKPLDKDTLLYYANKCKAVVTIEEHSIYGGLGSAVAEALSLSRIPLKILGINDKFGESGKPYELFDKFGLTAENILESCQEVIQLKEKNPSGQPIKEFKEINEIITDINHDAPKKVTEKTEAPKYDNDPRGRIIKMSEKDKKQVDALLQKMFGGRKN